MCRIPLSLCGGDTGYRRSGSGTVPPPHSPYPSTVGLDSHKAEGTVGNEEQLFAMGYQAVQDCKCFIPSQDVLL